MAIVRRGGLCIVFAVFAAGGATRIAAAPQAAVQAGTPPEVTQYLAALRWRSIGPYRAGRVLGVTGVRGDPEVYYFGSVGGGVWKSNDAGRTWNPIFDAQPVASIGAIAVAPSDPKVIYVGSGEADMRSSISSGNGMYKSTDGGKTWAQVGLADTRQIGRIVVDPDDANRVFVAALGHAYGPNAERGVFRSTDGGASWQRVLFKDENTGAIDVAIEPGNKQTMYAALWQTRRPPWSIYPPSNGPGSGLYRSRDGGEHWEQLRGRGLPSEGLGRIGIAVAPSQAQRVYVIMDAKEGGVYRSDDGGQNWKKASNDKRVWQRGWYFGELSVDPKNADTIYVPNIAAYRSRDGGATFEAWKGAPGGDDYHELWIDPDNPQRMIMGCDQGAIVTRNAGETWSSWYNQPTGQFYHVITDDRFPYWVYGAEQDSGAAAIPSRGKYLSLGAHDWRPMEAGDENGYIAADPLNPGVLYGGFVTREDLSNEEIRLVPPSLAHAGSYRRTWTLPLVFSPKNSQVLYFASQILFRTADGGSSWQAISPDLTREDPGVPAQLDSATAADAPPSKRRGVVYTIGPSYVRAGEIWAGTDDGLIHLTQNEGQTWNDVTPPELTPWSKVTHIEASHFDAGTAYAAVDRHRLEDISPYLYRTQDFGRSWKQVSQGMPEGSFLNCVREDPERRGLLYACTERGVYVSLDDGEHWHSLKLNLPMTSVRDLVVQGDDLVIATFGRSFWILDDVTPLRQLDARVAARDVWLFRPQTAYRVRPGYDQGTPVPRDEPLSANPPSGAILNYYLKDKSASPVRLEIFNASGELVRRFASDDKLPATNPGSVAFTSDWVHNPLPLPNEPGMHRFVWDLRYAFPEEAQGPDFFNAGSQVALGNYSVKLTASGESSTQPLTIKADPRAKATREALQAQSALALKLSSRLVKVSAVLRRTNELREQIAEREKDAAGRSDILAALDDLRKKIGAPAEEENFLALGFALPDQQPVPLAKVATALSGLLLVVESADAAPTPDAMTAARAWEAASVQALAQAEKILGQDLPAVNALLKRGSLQPLPLP
ncbi:MAG: hypothetical protein ABSG16_05295 [Candidatus Acidiferrum sp.]|jgi:photosystem II stability/assembly factor-like uncharacterized protein